jgi:lipoyl(octanoyl) transferase
MINVIYKDLGSMDYKACWDMQEFTLESIIEQKRKGEEPAHHLFFVEHPHVYTLGKSGAENNLLISPDFLEKIKATYYKIDRGGDITYHGPGQLVGYPIFDLEEFKLSVKKYIFSLEKSVIDTLADYKVQAGRLEGATGVWIEPDTTGKARKICAIGVRVSRFVTMHGFAFNINTDLSYFNHINPCGYVDKGVTSLEKEIGKKIPIEEVKEKLKGHMSRVFDFYCTI